MLQQLLRKAKDLSFERRYEATPERVWEAWTDPQLVRQWWGVDKTTVPECDIDLRVGGLFRVVMVAGEGMGKYAGTQWPMEGTFATIEPTSRLDWNAKSWTVGEEDTTTIVHDNQLRLAPDGDGTKLDLRISISEVGSGAKMAVVGMRFGYKKYLEQLGDLLAS